MIQRKPNKRLGFNGPDEVKSHPWFTDFQWQDLAESKQVPPFKPKNKEDNFDPKNINEEWKDQDTDRMRENTLLLRRNSVQALFNGYYFDASIAHLTQEGPMIQGESKDAGKYNKRDEGPVIQSKPTENKADVENEEEEEESSEN